jgi:hypothetical protein
MSFDLHSRTVRIGGPTLSPGCGYRDIVIHEMTEGEIRNLRQARWTFGAIGLIIGLVAGFGWAFYNLYPQIVHG